MMERVGPTAIVTRDQYSLFINDIHDSGRFFAVPLDVCYSSGMTNEKHADDDMVMVGYESSRNISFHGKDELGYTWGEWREMSQYGKDVALHEYLCQLVDLYVVDDELS